MRSPARPMLRSANTFRGHLSAVAALAVALAISTAVPSRAGDDGACTSLEGCPCLTSMIEAQVARGWVGIQMEPTPSGLWMLQEIHPGSPAEKGGMKPGDILLKLNGIPYEAKQYPKLETVYAGNHPGDTLTYSVRRGDQVLDLKVVLAPIPPQLLALFVGQRVLKIFAQTTGKGPYADDEKTGKGAAKDGDREKTGAAADDGAGGHGAGHSGGHSGGPSEDLSGGSGAGDGRGADGGGDEG